MRQNEYKRRTLGRHIAVWLSLGFFVSAQGFSVAAPILPDTTADITKQPLVQETANHIPLVNITAPTAGGVSMNHYEQFNVEREGAILNNAYRTSQTQLAGFVQGNANMINGTAQVIVNQVTSEHPTAMEGFLEVAGQKASVVVANPNGITVNGGGFINTADAVLTTGTPELDSSGRLTNYRVEGGRVAIEGNGLDATATDSVAILSRATEVNAGIWANRLAVRNGVNTINAHTLEATPITSSTSSENEKPAVALDVAAVGGMYANHITLVGTETGLGVNVAGVVAGTDSLSLDTNGHLSVTGTVQSNTHADIQASTVDNAKTIASGGTLQLHTDELTNTGHITSAGNSELTVTNTLDNTNTIAAGANAEGAITSTGSLSVTAGTIRNTDAVLVSGGETIVTAKELHNTDNGRIYGNKVSITADTVENRKNVALESKLADVMQEMKAAEDALEAAYAVDTTAFTTKEQQDQYLRNVQEKYKAYDKALEKVTAVQEELAKHKGSTIAGHEDVSIDAKRIVNAEKSLIYSGNTAQLTGTETIINHGGTIDVMGDGAIQTPNYQHTNSSFTVKRVSQEVEQGALTPQENKIRIDDGGHSESGQAFAESEFTSLGSGYGALHNNGKTIPKIIYDEATYELVTQITPEEEAAGEERVPEHMVGTMVPTYAYNDDIFKEFGITSMPTERPEQAGPEQDAWDAQFKPILASLNEKIKAHNAKAIQYNKIIAGVASEKIDRYTIIRTQTMTSHEEVRNSTPGTLRVGGNLTFEGQGVNENSQIVVGGTLTTNGKIDQVAKEDQEITHTFGTTESTYTYKRRFPHRSRRRGYNGQVFMTPQVDKDNPTPLGVAKQEDEYTGTKGAIGDKHRQEVQDFLNPFVTGNDKNSANGSKPNAGFNVLDLPTSSLYQIHPEVDAKYVVETDSQFTNKKQFLSSDYMYQEMRTRPELIEKRLGDGFYEQTLIREQIVRGTGFRFLDGYTDDERQFKALMDAGVAYAKQFNLTPGVALTKEQVASLTSDMVWLETATIVVDGKEVEVIYPKVYLKNTNDNHNDLVLKTDGTLMSANKLVMDAKEAIRNEGVIQGKTVILNSEADVTNTGHIYGNQVGIQSKNDITNTGHIRGTQAVQLKADKDISVTSTTDSLMNQDVLNRTAGIAVTGDKGVMVVSAGQDVNLTGATLEALGDTGAILISAGHDVKSDTNMLSAKKDMTQDSDNYLRTYRRTELGTAIAADGDISIAAKHDLSGRNLTATSEEGAIALASGNDISLEHGYAESNDAYGIKYKEKGFLNKKETKIKTQDASKTALMSTISGKAVTVAAEQDVSLLGTNVVSTEDTKILAGRNLTIDAAEEHGLRESSKEVKKSGLMGAGIGFMIGKQQSKDNYRIEETTHKASTIGATDGSVTLQAGDTAHLTTTDVIGKTGVSITAQDILLDGKDDVITSEEVHERKSSGLTVSLGGTVADAINTAYGLQQKAKGRDDKRLAALEYIEAGRELNTAAANIQDYAGYTAKSVLEKGTALTELGTNQVASAQALRGQSIVPGYTSPTTNQVANYREAVGQQNISQGQAELADLDNNQAGYKAKKRAKADSLANIKVSIGSSSSRSETSYEAHAYNGGSIASEGAITLAANSTDDIKGNIKAIGQSITGRDVNLIASRDISLEAGENSSQQREDYTSKGWSLGANVGINGSGIIGANAGINKAKQTGNTDVTTHTGSTVTATNTASITSGHDTTLVGSKVAGEQVTANVGSNLSIISVQDEKTYTGTSSNKGLSISTTGGSIGNVSFANNKGSMNSTYRSVTEQAGLYAGDKGFSVNTKGITSLVGAVIHSDAEANKNTLTTGSLITEDIQNTAEYTSRNTGVSYTRRGDFKHLSQAGKDAVWNTLGLLPVLQPDATDDAQSTTNSAISSGTIKVTDNAANLDQLSRDTANSLNKLDEIFDKKKVEERQELSQLFAKEAFAQLHDWNPTSPEGKAAKAIAHGIVAETSARIAGNKAGSGFYAGATNEALISEIQKIAKDNPAVAQWLSASIGAVVNAGMGNSTVTGAAVAQYGTRDNEYGRMRQPHELELFEFYDFIDIHGNTYRRTRAGDTLIEPALLSYTFVVQTKEKGHQLEGQEARFNSDRSWTPVKEQLGWVTPLSEVAYTLPHISLGRSNSGSWLSNSIDRDINLNSVKPHIVDTWPEKSTGKIYHQYSDGHVEFTGRYQGNENLKAGYPAIYNKEHNTWYADNYAVYDNGDQAVLKILLGEEAKQAMNSVVETPGMMFANGDMGRIKTDLFKISNNYNLKVNISPYKNNISTYSSSTIRTQSIELMPKNVQDSYHGYNNHGWKGNYSGQGGRASAGKVFKNKGELLPVKDKNGQVITYNEYDVNIKRETSRRDKERFVHGSDGSTYYTNDHYESFTKIK